MRARRLSILIGCALLGSSLLAQVSPDRILNAQKEPQNWLTYSGTYMSQRYSQLTQITPANVRNLELKWVFQARWLDYNQATPLVVDGIMYTTQGNDVLALDATTGKIFWIFPYTPSADARFCCGRITRGLAILGDTLFLATIDAHLIAIDAKSGRALWNTVVANGAAGYSMSAAPLVIKDKVIVGTAGGEFGIRGFHRRVRCGNGKGGVAVQHRAAAGRTRPRHVGRRLGARRRIDLGDRIVRSGNEPHVLGRRKSRARLQRREPPRRQPLQLLGRRARRRYRKAEVALPVHAQRRVRLGRGADSGAGRYLVEGQPAQGDAVGQSQRLLLRARSQHRRVPAGDADREAELERRLRQRPADSHAELDGEPRGRADLSGQSGRHELVQSVVQPAHGALLRQRLGKHAPHLRPRRSGI